MRDYWDLVVDVWRHGFLGIDISSIVLAVGILLAAVVIRRLFSYFVLHQLRFWTRRSRSRLDDIAIDALEPPIRFIPFVVAFYVITRVVSGDAEASHVLAQLNRSLIILVIFWALFQLVSPVATILDGAGHLFTKAMIQWIVKAGRLLFVALGAATILEVWGIEVGPILAGLGLFGVAVALGAQDLFKNLISGMFIIGERRFVDGDWIKVDGVVEGMVESIGFRTTRLRQFDKAPVFVPNSKLADDAVVNYSRMTYRRISWIVRVEYRTTVDQLKTICDGVQAFLETDGDFVQPPDAPLFVRVDSFNHSSIDIMIYCFTKSIVWGEWLVSKEKLACAIKETVEGAGTHFALPSRSVYVERLPEGAQAFPPSSA
jgi:MscS family membrane protein